tara:strand:- start:3319 stop:4239 length:921 start_codon:yes stop_codon:yes gene_type:complete
MTKQFSTLQPAVLERWYKAAEIEGIPRDAYRPKIRTEGNGDSGYTFGIIHNENRFNRPSMTDNNEGESDCNLCNAVELAQTKTGMDLFPEERVLDYLLTINKFPLIEGFSLGITEKERAMYTTKDLTNLETELNSFLNFADRTGFEIFHNSPGFGATIPGHDHWHLTTFRTGYEELGQTYGFDAAEKVPSKKTKEIFVMPSFPFSHLIFQKEDLNGINSFLSNTQRELGDKYAGRGVPHTISQGFDGILVTIGKEDLPRSPGSGDVAGHIPVKSKEEFENISYEDCMKKIDGVLFRKEEMDLERFI